MKMEALNCWIEIQREAARFNFMQRKKTGWDVRFFYIYRLLPKSSGRFFCMLCQISPLRRP